MVAANRITRIEPPQWPRVPVRDDSESVPYTVACVFLAGLAIAWCGVCLGFGMAAGWAAWGAMF